MKTTKLIRTLMILMIVSGMAMFSCKKDDTNNGDPKDQRAALDNSIAENAWNDIFKQVDNTSKSYAQCGGKIMDLDSGGCATVTITPFDFTTWPKTVTIDFGSTNCLGQDGNYRRGKIVYVLTGRWEDSLTVVTINPDNYYVNDYKVEGTKTVTNKGHIGTMNGTHNLVYTDVVTNGKITAPDGAFSTWEANHTIEWTEGENTGWPYVMDDVFFVSGSNSGVDASGKSYTIVITSPLKFANACRWVEQGTVELTPEDMDTFTVDFGGGNCDNQATVTINGYTYVIIMN